MRTVFQSAGLALAGFVLVTSTAAAQATQTVTFEIEAIRTISVSGDPGKLTISGADPGQPPNSVTDASTNWGVTTNESGLKVTGGLDTDMPTGVTLSVELAAPTGGTSAGSQPLSSTAQDLVTGISQVDEDGLAVTYTLEATSEAGVVAEENRTVTLTLADGA